ncbi:YncE family protein [Neobacillus citreus]|uniref:YncE family protein n=1 Tax=Neobacillus citreus TaxID=2833578 RepID=A0A942YC02_9BACI|nr:YncE family protein [Neobacillus citreus]MCH6267809.1 YncE family protein [Neobacillus citreus]
MKRLLALFFTSILMLSLVLTGCGKASDNGNQNTNKKTENPASTQVSQFLFTANEGGSISKISVKDQNVVSTIKVEGAVHNIQVSPDGKVVAATVVPKMAHGHNESMDMKGKAIFIDPKNDKIIKEVAVGNHPAHIVFTENGKYALVTNNEDNNVSVIDAKKYEVVQTIPTGKGPHGFRIAQDSQYAYVANMGENSVSVLNLESMKEEKKIKVGTTPVTTGITSDNKTLVVTLNKENALAIVDLASGNVDKVNVGNGPAQVYIQQDNQFAYVANQGTEDTPSHTLTKVDLQTKQAVATIETGKGSHGVVTSPDNKFTYVTNMFEDTVSIIDNAQNRLVKTIQVGKTPNGISITP